MKIHDEKDRSFHIARRLINEGFKAFFVGGVVRDMLMMGKEHEPSDFDILTNAPLDKIMSIFAGEKVKQVGKSFSVCIVNGIEVASCRSDSYRTLQDSSLGLASDLSESSQIYTHFPECDLSYRDITINSMALDPISGAIIDPFGGKKDIVDRVIRFTGSPDDRILEDPLRMVRVCRFASLINGTIDSSSLDSIIKYRHLLNSNNTIVAPERIRYEIIKAMSHKKPSLFFRNLHKVQLLELIFPSLSRCDTLDGGPHHGESVMEHCLLTGDALSAINPILRLAGYLHDAGKYEAAQIKDGYLTFPDHEKMVDTVIYDLHKLRFSSEEIKFIGAVIRTHMRPLTPDSTPKAVRRLLAFLKEHDVKWQIFMQMRIADKAANLAKHPYSREDIKLRVRKIWNELNSSQLKGSKLPLSMKELAISGHDVMEIINISEGPEVGKVMSYLFDCVLDEPTLNTFESLKELAIRFRLA